MLKPIMQIAAVGFVGVLITKLLWLALLPLFGMFIGFVVMSLKIVLIVGLVWAGYMLFRKLMERPSEA